MYMINESCTLPDCHRYYLPGRQAFSLHQVCTVWVKRITDDDMNDGLYDHNITEHGVRIGYRE